MASGVQVSDDAFNLYQSMKMKKKHRYMLMQIENGFIVEKTMVEKTDDQSKDFENFLTNIPKDTSCFIILDLKDCKGKDNLYYIAWCPDCAGVQNKMLYATTKQAFLDKIKTGTKNVQANDITDLVYEDLLAM